MMGAPRLASAHAGSRAWAKTRWGATVGRPAWPPRCRMASPGAKSAKSTREAGARSGCSSTKRRPRKARPPPVKPATARGHWGGRTARGGTGALWCRVPGTRVVPGAGCGAPPRSCATWRRCWGRAGACRSSTAIATARCSRRTSARKSRRASAGRALGSITSARRRSTRLCSARSGSGRASRPRPSSSSRPSQYSIAIGKSVSTCQSVSHSG